MQFKCRRCFRFDGYTIKGGFGVFYRNELQFLCDVLRKSRLSAIVTTLTDFDSAVEVIGTDGILSKPLVPAMPEAQTLYHYAVADGLSYRYLLLPEMEIPTILFVGPYLTSAPSHESLAALGVSLGISPSEQARFEEYYTSIPVLYEGNPLFMMITTFCEHIWRNESFALVDINEMHPISSASINETLHTDRLEDSLVNIKAMDQRYAVENEILYAVSHGQLHKEEQIFSVLRENVFEKRLSDPLRNAKNYCIIMNTLVRKAAEHGGVHPLYLDRVSSAFAAKIESMHDLSENTTLMRELFRSYCRLVRRHSMKNYSLIVQKTILLIDSDLSANLSLKSLAAYQKVSPGYLSTIFKKNTGKTVSEYIQEKRIGHAAFLLATTHQQIQTVALHCGIVDVQYFSKIFKKLTGKTPKEYRESVQK